MNQQVYRVFFVCANFSTEELGEVIPYMLQVEPSRRPGVLEVNHFLQGPLWKCGEGTSQSEECHFESWYIKYSLPTKNLCLLIDAFVGPDRRQQFSSGNPMELTRILAPKHHFWGKRPSHDDEKEGESWNIQDVQCITQASRHAGKEVNIVWRGHGCVENACAAVMLPCLACTF